MPGPGPTPAPRPAPDPRRPDPRYAEAPSEWDSDENTHMISKLGYVPKESRGDHAPEYFDTETVTAADRSKFRTRKRAKKSSPLMKVLAGVIALLVLGGIGFGVWTLVNSGGDANDGGLAYAALKKPCDALDTSPIESLVSGSKVDVTKDEVEKNAHSTEQFCETTYGKTGEGGYLSVHSMVFKRDAGAKNAYEDAMEEAEANAEEAEANGGAKQVIEPVDGVGAKAYSLLFVAAEGSKTVDYMLAYYVDNAYIETRLSAFNGAASEKDVRKYTEDIAAKYMENWAGA